MKYYFLTLLSVCYGLANGQTVKNISYTTQTGEKVLRLELVLPINAKQAWQLFTTDEQLKKWIAPAAHIELRTGGFIVTNYDVTKPLTDSSSIKLGIISYIEGEMLSLQVKLNNNFSKQAQSEDANLQEIIQLIPVDEKHTRIVSSMIGWGTGDDWVKTYRFFERGNTWTYGEILKIYK